MRHVHCNAHRHTQETYAKTTGGIDTMCVGGSSSGDGGEPPLIASDEVAIKRPVAVGHALYGYDHVGRPFATRIW